MLSALRAATVSPLPHTHANVTHTQAVSFSTFTPLMTEQLAVIAKANAVSPLPHTLTNVTHTQAVLFRIFAPLMSEQLKLTDVAHGR